MKKPASIAHWVCSAVVFLLCVLLSSCGQYSVTTTAGTPSAEPAVSALLELTEAQKTWVEDMLLNMGMTGDEHKNPYPIKSKQALAAAALQYADDHAYQIPQAGSSVTITLFCSESGKWVLTWTGKHSSLWYGKPAGWCYGLYIDAANGTVTEQPSADFEWIEETDDTASSPITTDD